MSNARLFVEAVDTAITLGYALIGWLIFGATVAAILLLAAIATGAYGMRALSRGVAACLALVQRSRAPEPLPEPHRPAQTRVAHSRPTWAQPDEDAA